MPKDLPTGISHDIRHGTIVGYRVQQWVEWPGYPEGRVRQKRFPLTAKPGEMEAWREERRVEARRRLNEKTPEPTTTGDGFLADADRYLNAVQAMPQFAQRKYHIQLWADLFGDRSSDTIASHEIRAQRDRWLTSGPKWIMEDGQRVFKPLPLSPQEVNLRLRALENMWTVLWPNQPNLVREVPEASDTRQPVARGQSFALAREILAKMPDITSPTKGGVAEVGSLSRIRFEAMLMTGLTHKQIGMLREEHVDYAVPSITPPARSKGRQARRAQAVRAPRARPLLPAAVPVLRKFFAMGANKPFSRSSFWRTVKRAVQAVNAERAELGLERLDETLRPYDWTRHTYGTEVYRTAQSLEMVQEMLGHSDIRMASIYAQGAVREHTAAVIRELDKIARPPEPEPRRGHHRPRGHVARPGTSGGRQEVHAATPVAAVRLVKRPKH